ncbi:hypothetical protein JKL49_07140 [Phenylobacterium sp. 20VBR1]|uniref:Secreted protein n=1 Tax=Phenylobacterium glaciei TaxID=2803784 RepID=A0A941D0B0_9CAUL|nr:hypothetical protein [Phenylobacterium glaciei]MBR7619162.1 hypothetical protein [Phenylobacterium glaciei]
MFKSILAAALALVMVSCAPAPPPPISTGPDVAQCTAKGGTVRPVCRMQNLACVISHTDAGKTCSDKSDCQGRCLYTGEAPADPATVVTGQCQATSDPCGCFTTVVKGHVGPGMCVD